MIKSIKTILSQDKEKFKVPNKVQDLIPIKCIWPDGIFKIGNKFSKTYKFSDMLSNSEFVIMLNQAASDREKLAQLLNISNEQMSYITNADAGCGLIKYGSALVPFINQFPRDTKLYQLMTTRPGEGDFARGQD